eukprot:3449257-Prymnesium_polylepis.1
MRHETQDIHVRVAVLHRVLHRHCCIQLACWRIVGPTRRPDVVPQLAALAVPPRPIHLAQQIRCFMYCVLSSSHRPTSERSRCVSCYVMPCASGALGFRSKSLVETVPSQ